MNTINVLPLNTTATQRLCEAIRRYTNQVDESQEEYIFHHVHSTLDRDQRLKLLDSANVMLNFFRELLIKGLQTGDFNDHNPDLLSSNIVDAVANCAYKRWFWKNIITLEGYIKQQTKLIVRQLSVGADGVNNNLYRFSTVSRTIPQIVSKFFELWYDTPFY